MLNGIPQLCLELTIRNIERNPRCILFHGLKIVIEVQIRVASSKQFRRHQRYLTIKRFDDIMKLVILKCVHCQRV